MNHSLKMKLLIMFSYSLLVGLNIMLLYNSHSATDINYEKRHLIYKLTSGPSFDIR